MAKIILTAEVTYEDDYQIRIIKIDSGSVQVKGTDVYDLMLSDAINKPVEAKTIRKFITAIDKANTILKAENLS